MKLNPPETAPKDGVILAIFRNRCQLLPAVWVKPMNFWAVAVTEDTDEGRRFLERQYFDPKLLRGWMPMPTIDDEGNVA